MICIYIEKEPFILNVTLVENSIYKFVETKNYLVRNAREREEREKIQLWESI